MGTLHRWSAFQNKRDYLLGYGRLEGGYKRKLRVAARETAIEVASFRRLGGMQAAIWTRDLARLTGTFRDKEPVQEVRGETTMLLNEWITENSRMFGAVLGDRIRLITVLQPDLPAARTCPRQMSQILLNLADCARQAMPEGGEMTLETSLMLSTLDRGGKAAGSGTNEITADSVAGAVWRQASLALPAVSPPLVVSKPTVILRIADTGHATARELSARVEKPFLSATPAAAGSGLGVTTVAGLVQRLGGHIRVDGSSSTDSSITLHLPPAVSSGESAPTQPSTSENPPSAHFILLVEDADDIRHLMYQLLTLHGYSVLAASSGPEAMHLVESAPRPINLLITDVEMPGMSGKSLAEKLLAIHPSLRILFVSGYTANLLESQELNDGAREFLQKPFRPQMLLDKVSQLLRQ